MAAKAIFVLCAQALFIQSAFSACPSRAAVEASGISSPFGYARSISPGFTGIAYDGCNSPAWAYDRLAYPGTGCAGRGLAYDAFYSPAMEFTATSGGALPVTSSSAMAPIGISVVSENVYEGPLNVAGEIPFVGTSCLEGVLPTTGSGAINHACGNGLNTISALSESSTPASVATAGSACCTGLAYDEVYVPSLAGSAVGANAFACDRLTTPGFAAPVMATPASVATAGSACCTGLAYDEVCGPSLDGSAFGANAFACDRLTTPGFAAPVKATPASVAAAGSACCTGLAYDEVYGPSLASSPFGTNAFACKQLTTPTFAAPVMAYDALSYTDAAWTGRGLACDGVTYGSSFDGIEITPTSGGALPVSSASAMPPTGISVASDNTYEGALAVGGELPFVGTVAMEGVVPSAGAGAVNHACGSGRNAMISETSAFGPAGAYAPKGAYGPGAAFAPSAFAPGFGASAFGFRGGAGRGCGCAY